MKVTACCVWVCVSVSVGIEQDGNPGAREWKAGRAAKVGEVE